MNFTDYPQAFNQAAQGKYTCQKMTMDYLKGGKLERFHLWLNSDKGPFEINVDIEAAASIEDRLALMVMGADAHG